MSDLIRFLSVADVLQIQVDTLKHEGGLAGLRDPGLLDAAVAMPRQQFGGALLHDGLPSMAAAYLFHIANNHAFLDGNKRAAAMAALVFLKVNGVEHLPAWEAMTAATLAVASGTFDKDAITLWFQTELRA